MCMDIRKSKLKKYLSILMGLSLCNNIFYIIHKSNFYLNISNLVSVICLFYIFIYEKDSITRNFKKIDRTFIFYVLACLLSIIPASISLFKEITLLSAFFNGIPSLIFLIIEYFVIISFSDNKENILDGIKIGFIVNITVSVIQYIYFINDRVFLVLYNLFPTDSFQVCGKYEVLSMASNVTTTLKVYFFRAQGLFIETSYFTTFVVGAFIISLKKIKRRIFKIICIILSCYLCLISESGNFIILIAMVFLYFLIMWLIKNNGKIQKKQLIIFPVVIVIFISGIIYCMNNDMLMLRISNTFSSTNISDSGNSSRKRTIDEGINLIEKYPLGIGYNMTSTIFNREYPTDKHSYIFSTIVVDELELGVIGNIVYLIFALKFALKIIKYSKKEEDIAIALSILGLFLCQSSNGINYWNIQYIIGLYAIGNIVYNELKEKYNSNLKKEIDLYE